MARPQKASKKKKWFTIVAPKEFNGMNLGLTPAWQAADVKGRTIWVNLMQITNDPRKQNINLQFKMKEAMEDKVDTETITYEISNAYIKRVVRAGKDKVEDSFVCTTKDNVKVRLKPLIITANNTKKSVLMSLRKATREFVDKAVTETSFPDLISAVINGQVQKDLRMSLKKIYPLNVCDFRVVKRV